MDTYPRVEVLTFLLAPLVLMAPMWVPFMAAVICLAVIAYRQVT